MKKSVQCNKVLCDECGKETYGAVCLLCGKDWCYDCEKLHVVEYTHAVYFHGSGDGHYCKGCDSKLLLSGKDKLHNAYRGIERLKLELEAWSKDFERRKTEAENALKKAQRA